MSWSDQGFSLDMTHPREILSHLYAALNEREGYEAKKSPEPLDDYDFNKYFISFDSYLFNDQYGMISYFSIPGEPVLPDPADIIAGKQIPFRIRPITIEYLEKALGEPLIRIYPYKKAWLTRKLYLPWVIQRYRILNLMTEKCGKLRLSSGIGYYRDVYRSEEEGTSGMVEELMAKPFQRGWASYGITSESVVSMNGSKYYWRLSQESYRYNIFSDISFNKSSCDVQVYAFGANINVASSAYYCFDQVSETQHSDGMFVRSDYDDYGYGVPLGEYTMIKSFTYDAETPKEVYFLNEPPADLPSLPPLSGPDKKWYYKSFILPEEGHVVHCNYAPYLKYYDPPE